MAKKMRTPEEASIDPATQEMLARAEELGIETAFSRADKMLPCPIGAVGMCCKNCSMGPCRLTKDGQVGVCGATLGTIQARNLLRAIPLAHQPIQITAGIWHLPLKQPPMAKLKVMSSRMSLN